MIPTHVFNNVENKKRALTGITVILASLLVFTARCEASYLNYSFAGFNTFDFDYGSWTGDITPGASYITVGNTLADNFGGAGFGFAPISATATPPASTFLVVSARLLSTHSGGDIRLSLGSNMGADYTVWSAPASLFNTTTFTTVYIPLSTPPAFVGGLGVDLNAIDSIQIQGDYFSPGNFRVEFESLALIPEPHYAMVTMLLSAVLTMIAWYRRHTRRAQARVSSS